MALVKAFIPHYFSRGIAKAILSVLQSSYKELYKSYPLIYSERSITSTTTDVLDVFTDKLIQEKSDKWKCANAQKVQSDMGSKFQEHQYNLTLDNLLKEVSSIDNFLRKSINVKDRSSIVTLLNYCEKERCCPSSELLLKAASTFSRHGDKNGILALGRMCEVCNKAEYISQSEYKHYLAEAAWVNGNVGEALDLFASVYKHNATLRRKVRNMAKFLFSECVSKRSEASVVLITNFAKDFANEYEDYYFLTFLWQFCFLSKWFSDQKMALELLEQYEELRRVIKDKLYIIALAGLKQDDTDVVHRLLEIMLQYDMRQQYVLLLREYFDYKCAQGDIKGCFAIIASASELNVCLKEEQQERFLTLVLDSPRKYKSFKRTKHQKRIHIPLQVPSFQLKF